MGEAVREITKVNKTVFFGEVIDGKHKHNVQVKNFRDAIDLINEAAKNV